MEKKECVLVAISEFKHIPRQSEDSIYAALTIDDLLAVVTEIEKGVEVEDTKVINTIHGLFAPTASLQDTAIDNGWGERYIEFANRLC